MNSEEVTYSQIDFEMIFRAIFIVALVSGMVYMMETAVEAPRRHLNS